MQRFFKKNPVLQFAQKKSKIALLKHKKSCLCLHFVLNPGINICDDFKSFIDVRAQCAFSGKTLVWNFPLGRRKINVFGKRMCLPHFENLLQSFLQVRKSAGIGCIEPEHRGTASGILGTIRSLGANFGVAVTGTLIADTQSRLMLQNISLDERTAALSANLIDGLVHAMQPAIDALHRMPESVVQAVNGYLNESYQYAFGMANAVDAMLGVIGLLGVLIWTKRRS